MAFETVEGGRRDNTHSLYKAKFRKALCFHRDDQVNKEARKEPAVLRAQRSWGGRGQVFVSEPCHTISKPYIWGQGSDLKLSPGEFYIGLTSDLLIPPTSPQALSYSSNMSFCRISQHWV